jgi:hypothetical protein
MFAALVAVVLAVDGGAPPFREELARLSRQVAPQAEAPWVKQWLATFQTIEPVTPRTWFCSKPERRCVKEAPPDAGFSMRVVDDEFIYARVADPLGYLRAYELAAAHGFVPAKKKVIDFGYGNLGALLPLATLGAKVHGVEVDPLLVAGTEAFQRTVTLAWCRRWARVRRCGCRRTRSSAATYTRPSLPARRGRSISETTTSRR